MMIGAVIAQKRKALGMSQEQLAEVLSVSRSAIAKWENDNGMPDIENLKALSKVLGVSIDELVGNVVENGVEDNKEKAAAFVNDLEGRSMEKVQKYLMRRCFVEMSDWNDGVSDCYIVGQDETLLFYVVFEKKRTRIGCLAKQYITEIRILKEEKRTVDLSKYINISKEYFVGKQVNVRLNERRFLDGFFGKDTEYREVELLGFSREQVVFQVGNQFMETKEDFMNLVSVETAL